MYSIASNMPEAGRLILVTGPARSGKSEWAEKLAIASQRSVTYIATAQSDPADLEWQARIEHHRLRRPQDWAILQVPIELTHAIQTASEQDCLLIDSLGTWLANLLEQDESVWQQTEQELLTGLQQSRCQIILVAEETGWGVVPAYASGRSFRDRLGRLVRRIGTIADPIYLVTAGYALNLKVLGCAIDQPAVQPI